MAQISRALLTGIAPEAVAVAIELGESVKPFTKTTPKPRIAKKSLSI